jgi:hypothetical protein
VAKLRQDAEKLDTALQAHVRKLAAVANEDHGRRELHALLHRMRLVVAELGAVLAMPRPLGR